MAKAIFTTFLIFMIATTARAQNSGSSNNLGWANRVDTGSQVVTTLHFYFHDTVSGQNPSAVKVAGPSTGSFGQLMMVDDPLTESADINSKLLGHARGMYGSASQEDLGLIMVLNYGFVDGIYNASSFSLLSLNPAMDAVREMSIVGGTGLFRLARGYALARTVSADATGDAVVEYNVTVVTYI